MRRLLIISLTCALVSACQTSEPQPISRFWRPISEPNILLAQDVLQKKLDFDLSQCHCGIYPANATHDDSVAFQPDEQRLAETGVSVTAPDDNGQCLQKPSLVVTECMRMRGWEPTNCSGRISTPGGGSLCAAYSPPAD